MFDSNRFNAVCEVAAAVSMRAILHASADTENAWGVLCCGQALAAFDPRSDAWVGRDGIPARFTFEEAELRARRLSGSSFDGTAYAALEIPSKPIRATVGPMAEAGAVPGSRFACIDWTSGPGTEIEAGDASAFGAAVAFVELVGADAASQAVSNFLCR